ncbi:MAG: HAD-IIB family hydrolase [Nanoarchaeota archaeon]
MVDIAVVLAGGLGTRLRPLTESMPKPLLPVHGKPIVEHTIRQLAKHGVKRIVLSIGYKADLLQDYFKDGRKLGVEISYSLETEPLGTGGAVKKAAAGIEEPFFLVWGDNLMDIDYSSLRNQFAEYKTPIIMALTERQDVENFGVAKLEENKIISFVEKPKREEAPSKLINAGAFIVDPSCLDMLPEGRSSLEKDCFEKLAQQGKISAYIHPGQWFPTDTIEKYYHANANFKPNIDYKEKKVIIADVDDTICESCQEISSEMTEQISRMIKQGYEFAFISGTKEEELRRMISSKLKEKHHLLATTGTHYLILEKDTNLLIYNHSFTPEEKKEVLAAFEQLICRFNIQSLTTKEDQLQDRDSQITLSAIGRHASSDLKAKYDPEGKKRQEWVEFLKHILGDQKYDIKIGGTTSMDITKKGMDKEWGIKTFAEHNNYPLGSCLFFGDKICPGGNDFPATKIVDCVSVKSPDDTLKELRKMEVFNSFLGVKKPWGMFEQYTFNEPSTVKILEVNPQQRLSLQSHQQREEIWVALDDGALAEIDGKTYRLKAGEKIFVSKNSKHRLSSSKSKARVLEISLGKFDENDIVRYEDDFGRISYL